MADNQSHKNKQRADVPRGSNTGPISSIRNKDSTTSSAQVGFGKDLLRVLSRGTRPLVGFVRKKWTYIVLILVALLPSVYFYMQSQNAEDKKPSIGSLQTTAEVVSQVSKHILLPSGEQPTVATVTDASKVRDQAFFANAASGDRVLIYAQAKKAYLYRPNIDRVIEVAPLAPNEEGQIGS